MRDALFCGVGTQGRRRPSEGEAAEKWHRSVLFHLLQSGGSLFRGRFHAGQTADFPTIARMRVEGMSDVAAMITRFLRSGAIGEMDCLYSYWATDHPHGFDERRSRRSPP